MIPVKRPSQDEHYLRMAKLVSSRSTCLRRAVGCVLVNKRHHVIATGYNGVHAGAAHCNHYDPFNSNVFPNACEGANEPSGIGLDKCQAIHAEQNALLQCPDVFDIYTTYVTVTPCITCIKLLLNTSCERIVAIEEYPHENAKTLWTNDDRKWIVVGQANLTM